MNKKIKIRVTAKSSRNRIKYDKCENGEQLMRVYVTSVPEDGKANKEVIKLLSKELKIPKSSIKIIKGKTCKDKIIEIT